MMEAIFPWVAGLVGLVLGSLYSVCVNAYLAIPGIPLYGCPVCHCMRGWRANIPVVSFLVRRGRCRVCDSRLPWRRTAMELISCALAALLAVRFGPSLAWLALMAVVGIFMVVSFIDIKAFILPDMLVYPGAGLGLAAGALALGRPLVDCLTGALAGMALFWLMRILYEKITGREGLGLGDVKLMAMIGAVTGWTGLPAAILMGAGSAMAYSVVFILCRDRGMRSHIPFGPFLCLGCTLVVLLGWMS